jgi:chromosome segregation ATPase
MKESMEEGVVATIVSDENEKAVLSVDDLIMKIGTLTVEKLELEKKISQVSKTYAEIIEKLTQTTRDLELKKQEYQNLMSKYNEVIEQLDQEKWKSNSLSEEVTRLNNENKRLQEENSRFSEIIRNQQQQISSLEENISKLK